MGKLAGLPAHALFVHIPIVLTPLTAVGSVLVALSQRWRRRVGSTVLVLAAVLAIATQLSIATGEELEEAVKKTPLVREHVSQSDLLTPVMVVLLAAVGGVLLVDRFRREGVPDRLRTLTPSRLRVLSAAGVVATIVISVAAVGLVVRAGHSGARAVWKDSPQLVRPIE